MRKLLLLLLLGWLGADAQQATKIVSAQQPAHPDTNFLRREVSPNFYHAIFIEPNRQSVYYKYLTDFTFDKYDSQTFRESYKQLKGKKLWSLKKNKQGGLPRDWMPLYLYKGKYYVYYPSEPGELARRIITDSTVVYWWMDGPEVRPIQKAVTMKNGGLALHMTSSFDMRASELNIFIIDPKLNIAVFEDTSMPDAYRYGLYIPKGAAKNFEMVVNYCKTAKTGEFEFDEPDFKSLLTGHK